MPTAPLPVAVPTDIQGRMSITLIDDRTVLTTTTGAQSTLVYVSRLQSADADMTTKVTEKLEIGTNGYTGGVASLGEWKGKLQREAVNCKLLGLLTAKKQDLTATHTTTWTYTDLANAKVDYFRLLADPTGFVFSSYAAIGGVLSSYEFAVKSNGETEETYEAMGKHLLYGRAYPIGKAYIVQSADITAGTIPIGSGTFGTGELPVPMPTTSSGVPPNSLQDTGRINFVSVVLIPSTQRTIGNFTYPANAFVRIQETTSTSPATGFVNYNTSTHVLKFGDAASMVAGDIVRVIFFSYGSQSTPTQIGLTSTDTTSAPGVPARLTNVTIQGSAAYSPLRIQDFSCKVSIPRKHVEGVGENEVVYGTAGVQSTAYNLSVDATDIGIDGVLQGGSGIFGNMDIIDADYLARFACGGGGTGMTAVVKNPDDNGTVLYSVVAGTPAFETNGFSGAVNAELQRKFTAKDIGAGPSITVTSAAGGLGY